MAGKAYITIRCLPLSLRTTDPIPCVLDCRLMSNVGDLNILSPVLRHTMTTMAVGQRKIETVPRSIQVEKSSKDMASSRYLVSTI